MVKTAALVCAIFIWFAANSQKLQYIYFKKKGRTTRTYYVGDEFTFRLHNKQWKQGFIKKLTNDSFYIQPVVVRYNLMNTDTVRFPVEGYSINDVYSLPEKGLRVDFKNGTFKPRRNAGHVKFYWIKEGLLFRLLGGGLPILSAANGGFTKSNNYNAFAKHKNTILAAGSFALGIALKYLYKQDLVIGKRFSIGIFRL
jgi:hypothetical protein